MFFPSVSLHRFLRERRAFSKYLVSRATQTIVSVWAPAAVARTHARNCADHWAPPPCSRCVARRRHHQGSCAPWKRAKGRAWSRATSALLHLSCACLQASPSSLPACYSTSSWSEGIFNYRIERESKIRVYERTEWNQIKHLRSSKAMYVFFLSKYRFWLSSPCSCCLLPSLSLSMSRLSLYHYLTHLLRVSVKGSLVLAVPRLGKKSDNQALKYLWAKQLLLKLTCMFFILYLFKTYSSRERVYFLTVIALIIFFLLQSLSISAIFQCRASKL